MERQATANFSLSSSSDRGNYVRLEQAGIVRGIGYVTKTALIRELSASLYATVPPTVDCGLSNDGGLFFERIVYAYKNPRHLHAKMGLTNGSLMGGAIEIVQEEERVNFRLNSEAILQHHADTLQSYQWDGDVWDSKGRRVTASLTVEGDNVYSSIPVWGTAIVRYISYRTKYIAKVFQMTQEVEDKFAAVAWAAWDGGVDLLEIDPPSGVNDSTGDNADCQTQNWGGSTSASGLEGHDKPDNPTASDETIEIDYCTQEIRE